MTSEAARGFTGGRGRKAWWRDAYQRARLSAAEEKVFAHYGIDATSEPLELYDPRLRTRVVRCGQGPATVLLHGSSMTATVWAPLLPHLPDRSLYRIDLPGCGFADQIDYAGVDILHTRRRSSALCSTRST